MNDKLKSLIDYCTSNGRVCPQPIKWNELYKMLPSKKRVGSGWQPPLPLILAAWWEAGVIEKRQRFHEHLEYADKAGVLNQIEQFLINISEDDWFHENDL
jgi:hypothetical protein